MRIGYVVGLVLAACVCGCVSTSQPVRVLSSSVEIYDAKEKRYGIAENVYMGQLVKLNASFTWDSAGTGGTHSFRWDLYKGEQCIRRGDEGQTLFATSPWIIFLNVDTTALGEGQFKGVLYVDKAQVATVPLTVKKRQDPPKE